MSFSLNILPLYQIFIYHSIIFHFYDLILIYNELPCERLDRCQMASKWSDGRMAWLSAVMGSLSEDCNLFTATFDFLAGDPYHSSRKHRKVQIVEFMLFVDVLVS